MRGFYDEQHREKNVLNGSYAANPGMKYLLLVASGHILAKANPYDPFCRIGLGAHDSTATEQSLWQGKQNW